jgi:alpha-amylase
VQQESGGITVNMRREGLVQRAGAMSPLPVSLSKTLFLPIGEERLVVNYRIENKGESRLNTRFASEWNINLLGGGGNDQAYYRIEGPERQEDLFDSTGETQQVLAVQIGNSWLQQDTRFTLSEPATLWRFSIDTVTGSEAGFERTHQGSCLTLLWPIVLDAGQCWQVEIACSGSH